MKKALSTSIILFLLISFISAQSLSVGFKTSFGLADPYASKGKISINGAEQDLRDLYNPLLTGSINLSVNYNVNEKFAFGIEPGFITKGYTVENVDADLTHYFFQLPFVLRYFVNSKIHIDPHYELGTILVASSRNGDTQTNLKDFGLYIDILEHSAGVGIGYQYSRSLDIGIKYSRGLSTISVLNFTDVNGLPVSELKERTQYLQAYFIYTFVRKDYSEVNK